MADTNASCDDPRAAMSSRELVGDAACVRLWSLLVAAAVARHRDTVFSSAGARARLCRSNKARGMCGTPLDLTTFSSLLHLFPSNNHVWTYVCANVLTAGGKVCSHTQKKY